MKNQIALTFVALATLTITGCESAPEVNTNAARKAANTAVNTVANAVNAVSDAASKIATESPEDFLKNAAQGGMMEVALAKVAASKAQNPEVKKLAGMIAADHEKLNAEVKALAGKKNVTLPTAADSDQSDIEELQKQKGTALDNAFIEAMIDDHENDIAAFQRQADNSTDPDVKAFAVKTLPTLKMHLDKVKLLRTKIASSQVMDN